VCSYKKLISALITLNDTTVEDFNANVGGVQTSFLANVAAAAGVSPAQVVIVSVMPGRRSLVDVVTRIEGAHHLATNRRGLSVQEWAIAHTVSPR
jgi:hypothetical protein